MIAEDVGETERGSLVGLCGADMLEAKFNGEVFETDRVDLIDTIACSPFFQGGPDD